MATIVIMPKQGLMMEEGTITSWLKKEGEAVTAGEPLFEMETDKLTITRDAEASGTLLKILHPEGDVVPITQPIAVLGEPSEDISGLLGGGAPSSCHRGGAGSLSGGWRRSVLCLAAGRSSRAARLAVGRGASSSSSSSSHMGRGVDRCWGTGARWGLSGALSRRGDGAGAGSAQR